MLTNIFIILNLGCEMLYVIDQRLKAQAIPLDKAAQVLRDITEVLLDPKFIHYITTAYQHNILTVSQTRILLTDIACCSLMRLDVNSMDKLWDLMIMIMKWQLFLIDNSPQMLMNLTFKHLDGIGKLIPEMRKQILIDGVKKNLINGWESICEDDQLIILKKINKWLRPYNTKISILIRMGLQRSDGEFEKNPENNILYNYYIQNVGENIYTKTANLQALKADQKKVEQSLRTTHGSPTTSHEIDSLLDQLSIQRGSGGTTPENFKINNEVLQSSLKDINIDDSNVLEEAVEDEESGVATGESNLSKFIKKIKMDTDSIQTIQEINPTEELLKMFDQNLEIE